MTTLRIPVAGPSIGAREIQYVQDAVAHGWYGNAQRWPAAFESAFAAAHALPFAVSLPSCTSAIHLALAALGVGPGDEVIVPDITWIATVAPALQLGATPRFADVDETTWCLSPESVESLIGPRTKAIIGVDLYGGMCDWPALAALARPRGIALVEDAAEAIGSRLQGRRAGTFGDVGVFSFHGSKTLTTGEGGMLITAREDLHARIARLRDHGRAPGDRAFWNEEVGFKYRMSGLQAALGLAQLERLDDLVSHKRALFSAYRERLAHVAGLTLNAEPEGVFNSYWMSTVLVDAGHRISKEALAARLSVRGIDTRPFFHPLSMLPAMRAFEDAARARARNRVAYDLSARGINLPSAACLSDADVERVCASLFAALDELGFRVETADLASSGTQRIAGRSLAKTG
jgi:perosamine synthetase